MIARDALIQEAQKYVEFAESGEYPAPATLIRLIRDLLTLIDQGWQSIGTAPKDGTKVVLFGSLWNDPDQRPRACVSWYCTERSQSPAYALGWFFSAPGYSNGFNPTHWQPLPAPPIGGSGQTDETTKERA